MRISRVAEALALLHDARSRHRIGYPALARRFIDVYVARRFSLREIAKLDLLDPAVTRAWLEGTASKQAQFEVQQRLNPKGYWVLTEDKHVFYRQCMASGLPVPRYFGAITLPRGGAEPNLHRDRGVAVLAAADAVDLIVKPANGWQGRDIVALRREGGRYVDEQGVARSAAATIDWLASRSTFDSFVVQERLHGHPRMQALSGTANLQTVRMVTYVRRDGRVVVGACQLKIIGGDALVDNFSHGTLDNLLGDVPRAEGVVSRAFVVAANGTARFVERHPRTGERLPGFRVPFWDEARALVERAALEFQPLRTIGWDVGITGKGPVLIEGNASWDPPQRGHDVNAEILTAIREEGEWD